MMTQPIKKAMEYGSMEARIVAIPALRSYFWANTMMIGSYGINGEMMLVMESPTR